mgnify:CR=1 FL=1
MANKQKILIVDDDENIANLISLYLTKECYETRIEHDGQSALDAFKEYAPNLILLDIMLPGLDGYEVCREIRRESKVPIIMLSAKTEVFDKVLGLELGADDYITKPFGTSELLARIRTSLRHSNKMNTDSPMFIKPYHAKDLTIDFSKRLILLHEQEIHLTPIEYKIVACLAKNSGKVVTYSSIMSDVWGPYTDTDNKILRVNMANIRRKLETNPAEPTYIFTELGVGYRMKEDESE